MNKIYICIDLKSFYASVECVERKLNPLTTNLVVADKSRTEKTVCLAVTPSLKQYGIGGRARLYEVVQKTNQINKERRKKIISNFIGSSSDDIVLKSNPYMKLDYIVAEPRMNYYMRYSNKIYEVYLKYFSKDDIYVYSIDEVFADITNYLSMYKMKAKDLVTKIIQDIYNTTGITATAGIGTNMYLAKIAMDIVAKHAEANEFGVRLAELDEMSYRSLLWNHKPITDFWRVGKGTAKRLEKYNMYTMGDIARKSLTDENLLYKLFGVNAELLIDHAWGYEPCTIEDIKSYKPTSNSLSSGQVLHEPYTYDKAKLIVEEMCESLSLDLVSKNYITDQIVLTIGYDIDNLTNDRINSQYNGEIVKDFYGRNVPKPAHGTVRIDHKTSSTSIITKETIRLYERIVNPLLLVRRINIAACNLDNEQQNKKENIIYQFDLFNDTDEVDVQNENEITKEEKEKVIQKTILDIKNKYGKNAILKGMNFMKGGTMIERNEQVGGHKG